MVEALTYLGFREYEDKHYHYELIGTGLILSFFPKSQKLVTTTFNTGKITREIFLTDEDKLNSYQEFIEFAKYHFLELIEEREQEKEPLTTLN